MEIIQKYYKVIGLVGALALTFQSCKVSQTTASKPTSTLAPAAELNGAKKVAFDETYFNGVSAKYAGDLNMAVMFFGQCLKLMPNNAGVHFELSQVLMEQGNYADALMHAKEAINQQPDNVWFMESLAVIYKKSSDYENAAAMYQKLLDLRPKQYAYYYELASAYLYANNIPMAIAAYEELEKQIGFDPQLAMQLVKLYMNQEQYNQAEQKLIQIVAYEPNEVQHKALLAKFYQDRGEIDKAIAIYEQMKLDTPNDPYVKMALYDFYKSQGEMQKAFDNLEQAFESEEVGVNAKLKIILGILDQAQTDATLHPEIQKLFEAVITHHPKESAAFAFYGEYLSNQKQLEKAQQMLIKAIELDNSVFQVWYQLLFVESELNQTDSLLQHSLACIDLYPTQVIPFYFAGAVYLQQQDYSEAITYLEGAKDLAYGIKELEIQILSNLGDAYYQTHNFQKAWMSYESALRQDPSNDYVLNNYAYFLCLEGTDLDKALEMSKRTVDGNPNNPVYLDTYGWILFTNKQYQEAVTYLRKAVDNDADNSPEILEHLGDAHFMLGNKDEALKWWQKAQAAGGDSAELLEKIKTKAL